MSYLRQHLIFVLGLLAGTTILLALAWIAISAPKVKSFSPVGNANNVDLNEPITLVFNKPINPSQFSATTTPDMTFDVSVNNGNVLVFQPKLSYLQNTYYVVRILYNQKIIGGTNFTTMKSQSEPQFLERIAAQMDQQYPLAIHLPYSTANYQVVYASPLTLSIQLFTSNLDQNTVLAEVKRWVSSQGVNPATHEYKMLLPAFPSPTTIH